MSRAATWLSVYRLEQQTSDRAIWGGGCCGPPTGIYKLHKPLLSRGSSQHLSAQLRYVHPYPTQHWSSPLACALPSRHKVCTLWRAGVRLFYETCLWGLLWGLHSHTHSLSAVRGDENYTASPIHLFRSLSHTYAHTHKHAQEEPFTSVTLIHAHNTKGVGELRGMCLIFLIRTPIPLC